MKKILTILSALFIFTSVFAQENLRLSQELCRKMALEYNEMVRQADNSYRQAELDKEIARTAYLPKVDGTATTTYLFKDLDVMGSSLQMRGMYMAGITLTQPIYAGGKIIAANKLSKVGLESAGENLRKTRMEVLSDADMAYWTYIAVKQKVKLLEGYSVQMDSLYRQIQGALSVGMTTNNDLLRVEARRSDINYQLQKAKNGANLCRLSLCHIINVDFSTSIVPTDTLIQAAAPTGMSDDISMRPEFRLLEKQVEAEKLQVKMIQSDFLPKVGLSAGYTYYGNINLKGYADAGDGTMIPYTQKIEDGRPIAMLSVSIPLIRWGEGVKKVKKGKIGLQNAQLDLKKNSRLLSIEARQAIQNIEDGYRMIQTAEVGLRQAEENLRVMRNRYSAQMSVLTDLLDSQSQWQQSYSNWIEALTQYKIFETKYLLATGRLEY